MGFNFQSDDCLKKDFLKIHLHVSAIAINQSLFAEFSNQIILCFQRKNFENDSFYFDQKHAIQRLPGYLLTLRVYCSHYIHLLLSF